MSEQLISTIDGKYLYAKSAASADVASKDEKGNVITGTYATTASLNALGNSLGGTINSMQQVLQPLPFTKQDVSAMTGYVTTGEMKNVVSTGQWADVTAGKQDKTAMTAYATTGDLAGKQNVLAYDYNAAGQITAIDGTSLAGGGGGGGGTYISPNDTILIRGDTIEGTDKALAEGESQSAETMNPNGYSIGGHSFYPITEWSQPLPDVPVTLTYSSHEWVQKEGLCFQFKDSHGHIVNGPELPYNNFIGTATMTGLYGNNIFARVAYVDPDRADYPLIWIPVNGLTARTDAFEVVDLEHKIDYGYDSTGAITSMNGSAIGGKTYEGVGPIVVDNDNNTISVDESSMQELIYRVYTDEEDAKMGPPGVLCIYVGELG